MLKSGTHNVEQFKINLESCNWEDIQQDTYLEVEFDLTASKKMGPVQRQKLLVKHFQKLDEDTLSVLVNHYDEIEKSPKKLFDCHTFTLCVLAETITENALNILSTFPFKGYGQELKAVKGIALIVDFKSKQIYGRPPGISIHFKKIFKELLECLKNTYNISEIRKSPRPEATYKKMKSELNKWGFGLMGFGVLHIVLASVLDPAWGVILIVVGICNILIPHRALFLVNGFAIMTAAVFNAAAMEEAGESGPFFGMLVIFQFIWGFLETRKYKLYNEVKWLHRKVIDR